jgi:hypothetical protein
MVRPRIHTAVVPLHVARVKGIGGKQRSRRIVRLYVDETPGSPTGRMRDSRGSVARRATSCPIRSDNGRWVEAKFASTHCARVTDGDEGSGDRCCHGVRGTDVHGRAPSQPE